MEKSNEKQQKEGDKKLAIYAIGDLHLSFSCNKPMDVFGPRWKNHTQRLEQAWRESVKEDDIVILPGDFSWAMTLDEALADFQFVDALPGKKILSKGNHDYWWNSYSKMTKYLKEHDISTLSILHNNAYDCGPMVVCGTRGWIFEEGASAPDMKVIQREFGRLRLSAEAAKKLVQESGVDKEIVGFLHYPPAYGTLRTQELIDILNEFGIKRCYYGHLHGGRWNRCVPEADGVKLQLVSADFLEFKPLCIYNEP